MPNIPQDEMNVNNLQGMSPDEAAASLAFATNLSQQLMPKMPMEEDMMLEEGSQSQNIAPKTAENEEMEDNRDMKAKPLKKENSGFEEEVMDELAEIKAEIAEILKDEPDETKENAETNTGKKE